LAVGYPDEELFVMVEVGTLGQGGGGDEDFVEEMGAYCFLLGLWGRGRKGNGMGWEWERGVEVLRRPCGVAEEIRPRRTSCLKGLKTMSLNSTILLSASFYFNKVKCGERRREVKRKEERSEAKGEGG
jgi:hypothetical protein